MASRKSKGRTKAARRRAKRLPPQRVKKGLLPASARRGADPAQLKPKPIPGEPLEDLAVFTKGCREQLSTDLQREATAVGESLDLVHQGHFDQALESLKVISRSSPLSDWRLFIRGLIAFYHRDSENARQNWVRLDRARRPARIAATLLRAETELPLDPDMNQPPSQLVEVVHERFQRRGAVAAAKRIAAVRHRDPKTTFSASQVAMLREFLDQYGKSDSEFVARFAHACVRLAFFQPHAKIFDLLKNAVPGPLHDPQWNLQSMLYQAQFSGAGDRIEQYAEAYIKNDLARLPDLPPSLKDALTSSLRLMQSKLELQHGVGTSVPFPWMFSPPDFQLIENLAGEAIKSYPANRAAHRHLVHVLQMQLRGGGLTKRKEGAVTKRMVRAKELLVKAFPDEIDVALWLIDHYFDEDELEKADALVGRLAGQRLDDPRARSLPWKLKLREAMRLSRRKTSLAAARKALDEADSLWPTWLSRDWLPFLQGAIELRGGDQAKFEQLNTAARQTCGANELVGDVMTFAALQQMNLPSTELKPLREAIERHTRNVTNIPLNHLCSLGSFFWDLSRTDLRHKGYRLQASKFGKVLCSRLKQGEQVDLDQAFLDACSWVAHHRFWHSGYSLKQPNWIEGLSATVPKVAAAVLEWLLGERSSEYLMTQLQPQIAMLQEAARTESDAFYRYRFGRIAKEASASVAEFEAFRRDRTRFDGYQDPTWDEDDEAEDDQEENDCDCPAYRAERARTESTRSKANDPSTASRTSAMPTLFDLDDANDDVDDDAAAEFNGEGFEGAFPPIVVKVFTKLGPAGVMEMERVLEEVRNECGDSPNTAAALASISRLFQEVGLSPVDAIEFLEFCMQEAEGIGCVPDASARDEQGAGTGMTPQERRTARKQRARERRRQNRKYP